MEWFGDEYLAAVEEEVSQRVERAGEHVADTVRKNIGIQGTPKNRSKPSEFPKRQTGELQSTIQNLANPDDLETFVGSDCPYAPFLIHGTSKMEPREFLIRTLNEESKEIVSIILGDNAET